MLVANVLLGHEVVQLVGELTSRMGVVGHVAAPDEISEVLPVVVMQLFAYMMWIGVHLYILIYLLVFPLWAAMPATLCTAPCRGCCASGVGCLGTRSANCIGIKSVRLSTGFRLGRISGSKAGGHL